MKRFAVSPRWKLAGSVMMGVAMSLVLFSAHGFLQAQGLDSTDRLDESTATGLLWHISVIGLTGFYLQEVPGRLAMTVAAFAGSAQSFASFVSSNRKLEIEIRIDDQDQVWWVAACFITPALLLLWDRCRDRAPWQLQATISMVSLSMLVTWMCVMLLPVLFVVLLAVM
jgi:hypothetical protein